MENTVEQLLERMWLIDINALLNSNYQRFHYEIVWLTSHCDHLICLKIKQFVMKSFNDFNIEGILKVIS